MSTRWSRTIALLLIVALLAPLLVACGGGNGNNVAEPTKQGSQPTAKPAGEPTKAPAKPSAGGDPMSRVGDALSNLMGTGGEPGVLPSFHLEVNNTSPNYDRETKEVSIGATKIKADVQGTSAHIWIEGEDGETVEGYVIGEDDYVVEDGEVKEGGISGVAMPWAFWQLDPVIIISLASTGTQAAGTEAVDGRTAEVYDLDMAKADPAVLAGIQAFIGKGITAAKGKVWVDQETGALLKALMDYEQDVYDITNSDKNAPPVGHGAGHIDIAVSQVGKVSVSLPN